MASRRKRPSEPEQFPVISGLDEHEPEREAGQVAVIPDDDFDSAATNWDAGHVRLFGE